VAWICPCGARNNDDLVSCKSCGYELSQGRDASTTVGAPGGTVQEPTETALADIGLRPVNRASPAPSVTPASVTPADSPVAFRGHTNEGNSMDRALFGIVRYFGLLITLFALVATVSAVVFGIVLYRTSVHQPTMGTSPLDYETYKRSIEPAGQRQGATDAEQARSPGELTEFQRQFDSYASEIIANGNRYVSPDSIQENIVRKYKTMTDGFPAEQHDSLALAFMEQFAGLSRAFAEDPVNSENLTYFYEKTRRWEHFIFWIDNELHSRIEAENERVQKEGAEATMNKVAALQLFWAAGVSFLIFVSFTLILVLLAIEQNTRTPRS
jgi:hypothetical protein